MQIPFVDVHTHHNKFEPGTVKVRNLFPEEKIEAFSGQNFYSVGFHPWHLKTSAENDKILRIVETAITLENVVFLGECGLDKKVKVDFGEQTRIFREQVLLAEKAKKTVIIHSVKSYNEILQIRKETRPAMPWILHGYSGNAKTSEQLLKYDIFFSFGWAILNENPKIAETLKVIPLERILFETDEFDGPVKLIYEKAAFLKNISVEMMKEVVFDNFNKLKNTALNVSNTF